MKQTLAAVIAGALLALAGAGQAQVVIRPAPAVDPDAAAKSAALEKAFDAAVAAARASLPVFWGRLAEDSGGSPDNFSLKVAFKSPRGGFEPLWLWDIKRQADGRISGRLTVDPESLTDIHRGQIVPIAEAQIIDWSFKEGRKRYGHFTTRVLAAMNPEESVKTMAALSDNPLPADARGAP